MKIRTDRVNAIISVIEENKVSSQEELLAFLEAKGVKTTQATLSRDLKSLKVAKQPDHEGGYVYVMPELSTIEDEEETSLHQFPLSGFVSIAYSGNMAVIKTRPGFANGLASVIDSRNPFEIIGTIAGDDTILLIIREGVGHAEVAQALSEFMPGIKNKTIEAQK
ncbi:MAG TPA: arginine repressor [Marinilabiliaceae bacterium]|nr:arginine repressor [Marinilabiliaceae bacterium]